MKTCKIEYMTIKNIQINLKENDLLRSYILTKYDR